MLPSTSQLEKIVSPLDLERDEKLKPLSAHNFFDASGAFILAPMISTKNQTGSKIRRCIN